MNNLQIDYFLSVAENLSFTKTATEKYVSQPAISKQITAMEEELGVLLFKRGRKSTELTDAGKIFADFYRRQRAEFELLSQQVRENREKMYIPLNVAFGTGWTLEQFMPDTIKKVQNTIPAVKFNLICSEFANLEIMLQREQADVIISLNINIHPAANIEIKPLVKIPGAIIYSKNHPAAIQAKTPADFKNDVFLVPIVRELDFIINLVNSFVEPYGFTPKIQKVGNVESMLVNIVNGIGVAIVDSWVVDQSTRSFLTMPIETEYTIETAWKRNNKNPALAAFLDELFKIPVKSLQ